MTPLLPAILALAAIDAVNPASITGAVYLAGSSQPARLRPFTIAVYSTYLCFGLALAFGPAAALRSALADTPAAAGPLIEVAIGGLLVAIGIRTLRRRGVTRGPSTTIASRSRRAGRSGLALGFLATLADLPTAGPLVVATTLLAGADGWGIVTGLGLYALVYISPLLVIAVAHRPGASTPERSTGTRSALRACAPRVAALFVAGAIVGAEGLVALL